VARVALRAAAMPAIWTSRISTVRLAAQLRDVFAESHAGEAGCDPRTERLSRATLPPYSIAEDLAHFLLCAAAVAACPELKPGFHVVVEPTDHDLSHNSRK
jgi:hypothetical protein